jgi:hypothetical protein
VTGFDLDEELRISGISIGYATISTLNISIFRGAHDLIQE